MYVVVLGVCRAFDVELLYIAQQLGMPIREVAVNWQEIEGRLMLCLITIGPLLCHCCISRF